MTRINLAGETTDQQVASLIRDIEELKTGQFISQNSGMLGRNAQASTRDDFGDIVTLMGDFDLTNNPTSHIPCPATPGPEYLNNIYCYEKFVPEHGKPTVVVPNLQLEVKSGGLTGRSNFMMIGYRFIYYMEIKNQSGQQVGYANIVQDLGMYMEPVFDENYQYAYQTVISYSSTVPFELSYNFTCRASDSGYTESVLEGLFF